jgi:hypothetical protein
VPEHTECLARRWKEEESPDGFSGRALSGSDGVPVFDSSVWRSGINAGAGGSGIARCEKTKWAMSVMPSSSVLSIANW